MSNVTNLWDKYNEYANKLAKELNRTSNLVGEYAEYLTWRHYGGDLLKASFKSADLKTVEGKLIQVKARKLIGTKSTQLGIIRSWDFDYLVVILFNKDGSICIGLEVPVNVAEEYAVPNDHQNGKVITTTKAFLEDSRSTNITKALSNVD